jgi:phosphatidate cytidylyltransferase
VKELILRTATGIFLVVLLAGVILLGALPLLAIVLLIYVLGTRELFKLISAEKGIPSALIALSGALLILGINAGLNYHTHALWLILPAVLWLIGTIQPGNLNAGILVMFWLALPLSSFTALGWVPGGASYTPLFPLSLMVLVWFNDIFAYVAGSLIGKHALTPRLSPGKTWEGLVGGILFSQLAGWLIFRITGTMSPATWMISAGIISLLGLAGDLFESGLKRRFQVKDSGNLLPGHGGILDRFDSLFFVAPALLLFLLILNLLK